MISWGKHGYFSEDEDQQFFDHVNDQSDDQSDKEGVGRPTSPSL